MAATVVMIGLVLVLIAQYLGAIVIHFDAKRLGIENPAHYSMGVYVPLGGVLVVPVYVSRRKDLAKTDRDETSATETD
ncbi:hypothetical protein [Natronorubrum texcoconense]|uniref:Uncharacterized protein n=1 Tax=Natronorubrum texcoconense TaxID=1095776 RepID=A0A1G9ADC8_9EURY|nr:hypothetical protein [Natronorubrum texcoconense]SDK25268.1 hypothetical protein SAMN04515672_2683 [Natronorubrum texcoconense]